MCPDLAAQVDIPHAARSALDTLRLQRLQKQAAVLTHATSPKATQPPLHDTLQASEAPGTFSQGMDPSETARAGETSQQTELLRPRGPPGAGHPSQPQAPSLHEAPSCPEAPVQDSSSHLPPMESFLMSSSGVADASISSEAEPSSAPPLKDTMLDSVDSFTSTIMQAASHRLQTAAAAETGTAAAPVQNDAAANEEAGMERGSHQEVAEDEMLLRQVEEDGSARADCSSAAFGEDGDEALLQSLLAGENQS